MIMKSFIELINRIINEQKFPEEITFHYISPDSDEIVSPDSDEIENINLSQAEELATFVGLYISRNKKLTAIALENDSIIGAAWSEMDNEEFSFDIAVLPEFQGKGIGTELVDMMISIYNEYKYDMPNLKMNIDVINPNMVKILSKKGFTIDKTIAHHNYMIKEEFQADKIEKRYEEYYTDRYLEDYLMDFEENEIEDAKKNFKVKYEKEDVYEFVTNLDINELEELVPEQDLYVADGKLTDVSLVYHQTEPKRYQTEEELIQGIIEEGLQTGYGSGINNRGESAVFTSQEIDEMNTYGYIIIEINIKNMKQDGYITSEDLSFEPDITEYHQRTSIDYALLGGSESNEYDAPSQDISEYTVLIRKDIPSKYIQIHNEDFEIIFTGERFK